MNNNCPILDSLLKEQAEDHGDGIHRPIGILHTHKIVRVLVPKTTTAELNARFFLQTAQTHHTDQFVLMERKMSDTIHNGAGYIRAHIPACVGIVHNVLQLLAQDLLRALFHHVQFEQLIRFARRASFVGLPVETGYRSPR